MATKRKRLKHSEPLQLAFNDAANSLKVSESGLDAETFLGALNAAGVPCGANKQIIVMNNAAAVAFIKFGTTAGMAAPTGITDGIMLPPNSTTVWCSGVNTHIRSSAVTVGGIVARDDISTGNDQAAV